MAKSVCASMAPFAMRPEARPCLSHDFPPFWPPISGTNNFYSIHIFMRGHPRAVGSDHPNVDSLSRHCPNQFPYECPVSIAYPTRKGSRNKAKPSFESQPLPVHASASAIVIHDYSLGKGVRLNVPHMQIVCRTFTGSAEIRASSSLSVVDQDVAITCN